jgi:hypothetical protein
MEKAFMDEHLVSINVSDAQIGARMHEYGSHLSTDIEKAAFEYLQRNWFNTHRLKGHRDNIKRWWPYPEEVYECCKCVSLPTARFPNSLFSHCKTYSHLGSIFGLPAREVQIAAKNTETLLRMECGLTTLWIERRKEANRVARIRKTRYDSEAAMNKVFDSADEFDDSKIRKLNRERAAKKRSS